MVTAVFSLSLMIVPSNYMVGSICSCKHSINVNCFILPTPLQRAGEAGPLWFGCRFGPDCMVVSHRGVLHVYVVELGR